MLFIDTERKYILKADLFVKQKQNMLFAHEFS